MGKRGTGRGTQAVIKHFPRNFHTRGKKVVGKKWLGKEGGGKGNFPQTRKSAKGVKKGNG